jgi:hypothetical protein
MKGVTHWTIESLMDSLKHVQAGYADGTWGPARPLGWTSIPMRLRCAWRAFTGKSDIVTWPRGQ